MTGLGCIVNPDLVFLLLVAGRVLCQTSSPSTLSSTSTSDAFPLVSYWVEDVILDSAAFSCEDICHSLGDYCIDVPLLDCPSTPPVDYSDVECATIILNSSFLPSVEYNSLISVRYNLPHPSGYDCLMTYDSDYILTTNNYPLCCCGDEGAPPCAVIDSSVDDYSVSAVWVSPESDEETCTDVCDLVNLHCIEQPVIFCPKIPFVDLGFSGALCYEADDSITTLEYTPLIINNAKSAGTSCTSKFPAMPDASSLETIADKTPLCCCATNSSPGNRCPLHIVTTAPTTSSPGGTTETPTPGASSIWDQMLSVLEQHQWYVWGVAITLGSILTFLLCIELIQRHFASAAQATDTYSPLLADYVY